VARPLPILLVHGFNGAPWDWTGGRPPTAGGGLRRYLLTEGGLDPDLVRLFRYGTAQDGTYDNRGDLRQIASRLAGAGLSEREALCCSVDRLSADSIAKGGPAQVTLVAHSLGGIICRYYLSRSEPDGFGTLYSGGVGRLIQIASPNRGVDLLRLVKLIPPKSLPWLLIRALEKLGLAPALPGEALDAWGVLLARDQIEERARLLPELAGSSSGSSSPAELALISDSPILQQLDPDGALLRALNRAGTMPERVECHTFYGDIRVNVRVTTRLPFRQPPTGNLTLLNYTQSFGDLTVPAASAREIPGASATPHPFITEKRIMLSLQTAGAAAGSTTPASEKEALLLAEVLPDTAHGRLLLNPAVHEAVISIIGRG
jgi:pimeloyl-ACP methyl ester carboxylesterase